MLGEFNGLECNEIIFKQGVVWNGEPGKFLKKGSNMACSFKSKDDSTKVL